MKKKEVKKEESVKETIVTTPGAIEVKEVGISPLEIDLGRGDLNLMRDKINEIIKKYGSV